MHFVQAGEGDDLNTFYTKSKKNSRGRPSSSSSAGVANRVNELVSTGPVSPLKITGVYWFKCLRPFTAGLYTLTFKSPTHPDVPPLNWDVLISNDEEIKRNNNKLLKKPRRDRGEFDDHERNILHDAIIADANKNKLDTEMFIKKLNFNVTGHPSTLVKHFVARIFEYDGKKKLYYGYLAGFDGTHFIVVYNDGDSQRLNRDEVVLSLINDEDVPDKAIKSCLDHIVSGNYLKQESLAPI